MKRFLFLAAAMLVAVLTIGDRSVSSTAYLTVDFPSSTTVKQTFSLIGGTLGSDAVHVWAFPTSGPVFLGASFTSAPDPVRQLSSGGWQIFVQGAPVGTYPIVVYAHDPDTGTFPTAIVTTYTVQSCTSVARDWPFMGPNGVVTFWFVLACA